MATILVVNRWKRIALGTCLLASVCALAFSAGRSEKPTWDHKAAAKYLDERQTWWMNWPESARDHQTFCVSCHTVVPYALARPRLRNLPGITFPDANDSKLLDNVTLRVNGWKEMQPFY